MRQRLFQQQQLALQQQLMQAAHHDSHGGVAAPQDAGAAHVHDMDWLPRLEHDALHNIAQSVQMRHFSSQLLNDHGTSVRGFTAEDFDVDDPYNEADDGGGAHRPAHPMTRLLGRDEYQARSLLGRAAGQQPPEGEEMARSRGERCLQFCCTHVVSLSGF